MSKPKFMFIQTDFAAIEARMLAVLTSTPSKFQPGKTDFRSSPTGRIPHPPKFNMKGLK
jgi:hypothetical protein